VASKYDRIVKSDPRSPRFFKACDVARIAENCISDTDTPDYVLLACVAKKLGYERVWVPDKTGALKSDKWDADKAFVQLVQDEAADVDIWELLFESDNQKFDRMFDRIEKKAKLILEREISIDTMTAVEAFEGGAEMVINFWLYRFYKIVQKLNVGFLGTLFKFFIVDVMGWIAGMVESFTKSIAVDVDDVLQANSEWCKCLQADSQDSFLVDKKSAKEFDKTRKKGVKGKLKLGGKTPIITLPPEG
jgi:hypothetical protein